jgi:hypothetical protein
MFAVMAVISLLLMAFWGWRKGAFHLTLRLSVLLLTYALTWQETPQLAHYLAEKAWLTGVLVWPAAGFVLLCGGFMLFSLLAYMLMPLVPDEWKTGGRKTGAVLGAVLGAGIGVLGVWTVGALQDAYRVHQAQQGTVVDTQQVAGSGGVDQLVRDFSGDIMANVVQGALGDSPAAEVAAQWMREPLSVSEGLKSLAEKPQLRLLFQDPDNYAVLLRGSAPEIVRLPAFRELVADSGMMTILGAVGLPGQDAAAREAALASTLSKYAGNAEKLKNTEEFQSLIHDRDLQAQLQQGNLMVLLTQDKVRRIAEMLTAVEISSGSSMQGGSSSAAAMLDEAKDRVKQKFETAVGVAAEADAAKPLYRWRDAEGRMHITQDKPPEGVKADVIQH